MKLSHFERFILKEIYIIWFDLKNNKIVKYKGNKNLAFRNRNTNLI